MSMTICLPDEIVEFVKAEVADGAATDEAEFLAKAVDLYRELKERHDELRGRVQRSLEQSRNGQSSPLDIDAIIAELREEWNQSGQPRG